MSTEHNNRDEILLEKENLTIGFIPLTDCAPLVVAKEQGFFQKYGLNVTLSKEASWANIRDKLAYGVLDSAHMLATMPITNTLGLASWKKDTITALVLGVNGNAITISNSLYNELKLLSPDFDTKRPVTADVLKQLVDVRKSSGKPALNFAHVFPSSTHNYFLRYWLASAGIDPDNDVSLSVIPPQQMVKNLEANSIDGFCVGEPWNQYAVQKGIGHALITSYEIWNNAPDKVLGVNKDWAYTHPNTHKALLKALIEAAAWADKDENREQVAELLSREEYINVPVEVISPPLKGQYKYHPDADMQPLQDFNVFHRYNAGFPWLSHSAWYLSQMIRWGDISNSLDIKSILKDIYWVDFYRQVADEMGMNYPQQNIKSEGVHSVQWESQSSTGTHTMSSDLFFDGETFDYS